MILFRLAARSLRNRLFTTVLTVLSIALSVALLLGVERVRQGARESFNNTISGVHLIVGAKGGTLQLLLYTVFQIGNPTNNISYESYEWLKGHPAVEWAIPISLGDSFRGFRVVATTAEFFERYRYRVEKRLMMRQGHAPSGVFDVTLGAEVAESLKMKEGATVVLSHGVSEGPLIHSHDDKPFRVVGILERTGTPLDRALFVNLQGMEAIHMDWQDGVPSPRNRKDNSAPAGGKQAQQTEPHEGHEGHEEEHAHSESHQAAHGEGHDPHHHDKEHHAHHHDDHAPHGTAEHTNEVAPQTHPVEQVTSVLVRTKSPVMALSLQREINTTRREPLLAIMPAVTLNELWSTVGYAERALRIVTVCVVVVGFLGMILALYTSLEARRREMAILRAVGAGPLGVSLLLVLESAFLGLAGSVLGLALVSGVLALMQPVVERTWGLTIATQAPSALELAYLAGVVVTAAVVGLLPAFRAYRNTLADGLSIKI